MPIVRGMDWGRSQTATQGMGINRYRQEADFVNFLAGGLGLSHMMDPMLDQGGSYPLYVPPLARGFRFSDKPTPAAPSPPGSTVGTMSSDLPQAASLDAWKKGETPPAENIVGSETNPASAQTGMAISSGLFAVSQILSSYSQSEAIRSQARLQRMALQRRIDLMKVQKKDLKRAADAVESYRRQQTRQLVGAQRVSLAAQGITLGSGTAQQLQEEAVNLGEIDALMIRNNANRQMMGLDMQIGETRLEKTLSRLGARTRAQGTIATGLAQAGSKMTWDFYNIYEG